MAVSCTGVILAGGESKRFGGKNKAFIQIGGKRIIDRLLDVYSRVFDQIVVVTNDPDNYLDTDALLVSDHFPARSSLNGLHAGLFAAKYEYAFFTACDTPFARERLIRHLVSVVDNKADIVLPSTAAGFEPLFALYRKSCLPAMAGQLENDRVKISGLFRKVKVKTVNEEELRAVDPELVSFFNINTPEDLNLAEEHLTTFQKGE